MFRNWASAGSQSREFQEKLARERIEQLLSQAKALDTANKIRANVESSLLRAAEIRYGLDEITRENFGGHGYSR